MVPVVSVVSVVLVVLVVLVVPVVSSVSVAVVSTVVDVDGSVVAGLVVVGPGPVLVPVLVGSRSPVTGPPVSVVSVVSAVPAVAVESLSTPGALVQPRQIVNNQGAELR